MKGGREGRISKNITVAGVLRGCFVVQQRHLVDRGTKYNSSISWKLRFSPWKPGD